MISELIERPSWAARSLRSLWTDFGSRRSILTMGSEKLPCLMPVFYCYVPVRASLDVAMLRCYTDHNSSILL